VTPITRRNTRRKWCRPSRCAAVELLLVVIGAALYWRAAGKAARQAGRGPVLPAVAGCVALGFGVVILGMDVFAAR